MFVLKNVAHSIIPKAHAKLAFHTSSNKSLLLKEIMKYLWNGFVSWKFESRCFTFFEHPIGSLFLS